MYATIQKWGNSRGIRIPKQLLEVMELRENDRVELIQQPDCIQIKKVKRTPHRTLEERLASFYGKRIDEIRSIESEPEIDWGEPGGSEVW